MKYILFGFFAFFGSTGLALAQGTPRNFGDIANIIIDIVNTAVPVLITAALAAFIWGIAKSILHSDNPDARASGRTIMLWGILSLFVITFVWGIITVVQRTFF